MHLLIFLVAAVLLNAAGTLDPVTEVTLPAEALLGVATAGARSVFTWGSKLRLWSIPQMKSRLIAEGPFGEGGCAVDLDGDGRKEFVSVRGNGLGKLVWLNPPERGEERVDDEVEMHDCTEATLFGRKGILMIQRGMQIRFYERTGVSQWKSRDIYSIYTPSYQTGLALADVDGDGNVDVFCGNYWVRSPRAWEESWRIFAINTWSETQESAMFRIAGTSDGSAEIVAQGHSSPSKIAVFDRPSDPKQQWTPRLLAGALKLAKVHGLARLRAILLVGEHNGPSSLLVRIDLKSGDAKVIAHNHDTTAILPLPNNSFITVGPGRISLWRH